MDGMGPGQRTADAERIYGEWHERAKSRDVEGLLALYAGDAVFESPLVPAILDDLQTGVLRGKAEIRRFLAEGTKRRPNNLVRWYRTGASLTNGRTLVWEYPRETPEGDQIDILELIEIENGLIARHRIYWGWFGTGLLVRNASEKAVAAPAGRPAADRRGGGGDL